MNKKFLNSKLILIIITSITFLSLTLQSCNSRPVQFHTYLIPSNYKGTLRIIYNEECGIKPRIEDGREILAFPKNGVLILNTDVFYSITGNKYYLIDGKGNKTKVAEIFNSADRLSNGLSVLAGTLTVAGYTYHNSEVEIKGIEYKDFKLFKNGIVDTTQNLDSLTNALVSACRAK